MNKMLGYLKDYKRESVLAPLFKMLEATFDLFVPLVMADIVNIGIAAHDFHYILVRCGILLLLAMIGLAFCVLAFVGIIIVVVRALMFGDPTSGWPSLVCIILLCSGVQLLCTGIAGEYLAKTYLETKHRPIYIAAETEEDLDAE